MNIIDYAEVIDLQGAEHSTLGRILEMAMSRTLALS